ncbi:MAG: ketoacyl-ACP synthase III [Myxococcota bacterium]|nr:ketoacyl-ACP synthase III [Myxococcota bacterium]
MSGGVFRELQLHGLGHAHPENEIDNKFLESLDIGTSDEWIMERVGIRSRRTAMALDYIRETKNEDPRGAIEASYISNAQLGARAAQMAVERAGVQMSDIGMLIGGGCAPDTASPAEACNISKELDLEVPSFDVNSACTSFFAGMNVLSMMRPEALPRFVLLVAADVMTRTVDYNDRASAVLWGDGAAAAVISTSEPAAAKVIDCRFAGNPLAADLIVVPRLGHFMQEGRKVQMFAIKKTASFVKELQEHHEDSERDFHFIGHQANLRMLETVCRRCEIPEDRHHYNVDWYGNSGSSSSSCVASMNWEKWGPSDDLGMVGVGSGVSWSRYLIRFQERR